MVLEGLAGQAVGAGPRTESCCCSYKSAISVGEAWWSVPSDCLSARQLHYTVSVHPDSSATLSPGWYVTLLLPILLASARFVGKWGMNEESQVRGCYNITFYLYQTGNSVGSPLNQMQ